MRDTDIFRIQIDGSLCVYCGEIASTVEHFPPKAHTCRGFLLPSCSECNILAGTEWPTDFEKRAEYVKSKIEKRYTKLLTLPEWNKTEIKQLGRGLREGVEAWQKMQDIARKRVAWNAMSYLTSIDLSNDFAALDARNDTIQESVEKRSEKQNASWRCKNCGKPLTMNKYYGSCSSSCLREFKIKETTVKQASRENRLAAKYLQNILEGL